jgi:hypothetical protein
MHVAMTKILWSRIPEFFLVQFTMVAIHQAWVPLLCSSRFMGESKIHMPKWIGLVQSRVTLQQPSNIFYWNEANEWDEICTSFVQKIPLECTTLSCLSTFTLRSSITFCFNKLENDNTSPSCIQCTLLSQIIPLLILTFVCMWYEECNPRSIYKVDCNEIKQSFD